MIRRLLPIAPVALAVLATALAAEPWLRIFPARTIALPLFGAALLGVLVAVVTVTFVRRPPIWTAPVSAVAFLLYLLAIVLRDPLGFDSIWDGFAHGPARLLSFALPLVSPSSLMVAPVALCWFSGAIVGEILTRRPSSRLPYPIWLSAFALAYAATARAYGDGGSTNRNADIALGAALFATLALLRIVQTWLQRDRAEIPAGAANALPLRGLSVGFIVTVVAVAVGSAGIAASVLPGSDRAPRALQRVPAVRQSQPLTPLAFAAALRPNSRTDPGDTLFELTLDQRAPAYVTLASVDVYDGDSWAFDRDFRPSGGVIPAETDPALSTGSSPVTQHYRIDSAALVAAPWLPYLARPEKVTGEPVSIDSSSAMIVPTDQLVAGDSYDVQSASATSTFAQLGSTWLAATSPPPVDSQLPASVRTTLTQVITALEDETGQTHTAAPAFLSALVKDLQANYRLTDVSAPATPTGSSAPTIGPTASPTASPSAGASAPAGAVSGGTSFAAVLASILGDQRAGTPEQYATFVALIARAIGVPARVVSGFRLASDNGLVPAGRYEVTASQAHTWVEIPVRGSGWVVLDPSPTQYSDSSTQKTVGAEPSSSPTPSASDNALVTQANGGHAVAARSGVPSSGNRGNFWLLLLIPLVLIVGVITAVVVTYLRRRRRRRRRRTRGDPRDQVIGAWRESLDVLREGGLGDLTGLTGAEVTTASEALFGVEAATAVAVLSTTANRAIFSSVATIEALDAEIAWRSHGLLVRSMHEAPARRTRLAALLRH
ncbi:MAG: Transglutaminase superfamily protein [Pseudonocardiales bacterium]|nr:Transglutaminase superfamily protein [Pseudonocardiales bacterium]